MTEFEKDMMEFILYVLADENSAELYYLQNNITSAYYVMELFRKKVEKHPILFRLLFKVE